MSSRLVAGLLAALLLASAPASAADNLAAKDALGSAFKLRSIDLGGGVQVPASVPVGPTGAPIFTSTNPAYVALPTGATVVLGAGSSAIGTVGVASLPSLPAGSSVVGAFRVDQTTPGSTNGVVVNSSVLPTGAPTAAGQVSGNASLASLDGKLPPRGAAVAANSQPVTVAADQAAFPVIHTPTSATGSVSAYTAGTSSAQVLAASARRFLAVDNESTTATIACAFGAAAAVNSAGSFTIGPLQTRTWSNTFVPADAVNCVASAAGTPVTVQAN